MKRQTWVRKLLSITIVFAMVVPLVTACSSGGKKEDDKPRVLRVGIMNGGYDDSYFRQQFTDVYEYTNNNLTIEIVPAVNYSEMQFDQQDGNYKEPDRVEAMKKLLTGDNPVDVIVTDTAVFRPLAREGLLVQLDTKMQAEKMDTSDLVPAIFEGLKAMGDNNLYGLAPTFYSSALAYNKTLFSKLGIEPPTDEMSWDDVFSLATRISKASGTGEDHKYGFSFDRYQGNDIFWAMNYSYLPPLNLRMFDDKAERMTVNSPGWEKAWTAIAQLASSKAIPTPNADGNYDMPMRQPGESGIYDYDLFLSGRTAMALVDSSYLNNDVYNAMRNAEKIKNFTPFEWDVVTVPTHAEVPGVSSSVNLYNIFSINTNAPNPDDAWDFIKFINSEEWAKIRSRSSNEMVLRKSFIKPKEGMDYNISAFYKVKPVPPTGSNQDELMSKTPGLYQVQSVGQQMMNEVLTGKKEVKEALAEWEKQGNQTLLEIKNNPNNGNAPGGIYR